jgi:hypothetical protein
MEKLNFKTSFFVDSPFPVFEIKNFLSNESYVAILNSFPNERSLLMSHQNRGKKYLNDRFSRQIEEIFKHSEVLREFRDNIVSEKFVKCLVACFEENNCLVPSSKYWRLCDSRIKFSSLRKFSLKVQAAIFRAFGFYPIRVSFEFGVLKKGDSIPPHNDSENKIVSLVYYLADDDDEANTKYGTIFFKKKNIADQEITSSSYLAGDILTTFAERYEEFHRVEYRSNVLSGFLRTHNSWHSVQEIESPNLTRKSIVINILKV